MAKPKIVKTASAERDLDALFDYIAGDSGVDRAEAVLRRIDGTIFNLAAMPRVGRLRPDLEGAPRSFSVWPWLILYEPLTTEGGIMVLRIVDGRRDLKSIG